MEKVIDVVHKKTLSKLLKDLFYMLRIIDKEKCETIRY